ncbi:MAG TPA: cobyrinic acid a,c-diamide synthase, partial [Rhodospirillaceae bacterium]|nr:cobyrinic acid a,c-diamide synthase [Rhodospirillaceae bacterium]
MSPRTANATPMAALRCPNMFAVASGKGGVGKTWFSITLCHALAKRGKRVLLFDGDLGLANVDIQLGLTPEKDLAHVVENGLPMADAVTHYAEGGFDILAGRSGSGNLATLTSQRISDMRSELIDLAQKYDYVFVDLGAGVDRAVRQMAGPAALTYIVITDEPTSLTDAYAFIKLSRAANPQAQMKIVINMAASANDGLKTYETINKASETFLKYSPPMAGVIRRDSKVRDAIRAQTPLLTRSPSAD